MERPSYEGYRALGMRMSMHLEGVCSYDQIAAELGVSTQRAHEIAMRALGKLAWGLQQQLQAGGKCVHN